MSRARVAALRFVALLAILASGAMACTIPTDEEARAVEDTTQLATTTSEPPETVDEENVQPYFLPLYFYNDEDGLVRIDRGEEEAPVVQDILDALAASPTQEEQEMNPGIATRFLPEMQPTAEGDITDDGLLTVRVQGLELREFTESNPERVQRIYTQIVCSMAATTVIDTVQMVDDEGAIRVQGDDGSVLDRPLASADVNECLTAAQAQQRAAEEAADGDGAATDGAADEGGG